MRVNTPPPPQMKIYLSVIDRVKIHELLIKVFRLVLQQVEGQRSNGNVAWRIQLDSKTTSKNPFNPLYSE